MDVTWEDCIRRGLESEYLSYAQMKQLTNALEYIRTKIFYAKPEEKLPKDHIISLLTPMMLPWTCNWTIDLQDAIIIHEKICNHDKIFNEIRSASRIKDLLIELSVGDAFARNGFEVYYHPSIIRNYREYKPDYEALDTLTETKYYIEVTAMHDSADALKSSNMSMRMAIGANKMLKGKDMWYFGKFHDYPSEDELKNLIKSARETLFKATKFGFHEFQDPKFSFAASTNEKKFLLENWAGEDRKNILDSSCIQTPNDEDKLKRIKRKIKKEYDQLDRSSSNIIIIQSDLLNKYNNIPFLENLIIELEEYIKGYKRILFCVLTACFIEQSPPKDISNKYSLSELYFDSNGVVHQGLLILENKSFEGNRNKEAEKKIIETIRRLKKIYL